MPLISEIRHCNCCGCSTLFEMKCKFCLEKQQKKWLPADRVREAKKGFLKDARKNFDIETWEIINVGIEVWFGKELEGKNENNKRHNRRM